MVVLLSPGNRKCKTPFALTTLVYVTHICPTQPPLPASLFRPFAATDVSM